MRVNNKRWWICNVLKIEDSDSLMWKMKIKLWNFINNVCISYSILRPTSLLSTAILPATSILFILKLLFFRSPMALSINEDDEMLEDIMENGNQDDDNDDIPEEETSFIPIPKSSGRPPRLKRQVKF